jgi:HlyD family secretion protein
VDAYPERSFTGVVSQVRLQPQVEQNVVSYVTVIDVPNPDHTLKPGMTAAVTIETARQDEVLRVPNAALRFRPTPEMLALADQAETASGRAAVWVLEQGALRRIPVRTGITDGVQTAVLDGELAPGAGVVTGVLSGAAAANAGTTTTSPLLPFGRGRGGR